MSDSDNLTTDSNNKICFCRCQIEEIIDDLGDVIKKLFSIENSLKHQILGNADGVEESFVLSNREGSDSDLPNIEHMIKKPIRRQIGNLKPARLLLENLVQRLGLGKPEE